MISKRMAEVAPQPEMQSLRARVEYRPQHVYECNLSRPLSASDAVHHEFSAHTTSPHPEQLNKQPRATRGKRTNTRPVAPSRPQSAGATCSTATRAACAEESLHTLLLHKGMKPRPASAATDIATFRVAPSKVVKPNRRIFKPEWDSRAPTWERRIPSYSAPRDPSCARFFEAGPRYAIDTKREPTWDANSNLLPDARRGAARYASQSASGLPVRNNAREEAKAVGGALAQVEGSAGKTRVQLSKDGMEDHLPGAHTLQGQAEEGWRGDTTAPPGTSQVLQRVEQVFDLLSAGQVGSEELGATTTIEELPRVGVVDLVVALRDNSSNDEDVHRARDAKRKADILGETLEARVAAIATTPHASLLGRDGITILSSLADRLQSLALLSKAPNGLLEMDKADLLGRATVVEAEEAALDEAAVTTNGLQVRPHPCGENASPGPIPQYHPYPALFSADAPWPP